MNVNVFTGTATGHPDPEEPDVVSVAWSVREGVVIEDAMVMEGTMLVLRLRVPEAVRRSEDE